MGVNDLTYLTLWSPLGRESSATLYLYLTPCINLLYLLEVGPVPLLSIRMSAGHELHLEKVDTF